MPEYIYTQSEVIRTNQPLERYAQRTPDGNDMHIAYINDVEYKRAVGGKWVSDGYRWCIAEPHMTEAELVQWLMNNGLKSLPFVRVGTAD